MMRFTDRRSEEELARVVVQWLQDLKFEVYQEVEIAMGKVCDIVARIEDEVWAIEVKRSLSFALLDQARRWRQWCHRTFAAAPVAKRTQTVYDCCEFLRVGVLHVGHDQCYTMLDAHRNDNPHNVSKLKLLPEHQSGDYANAGTQRGGHYTQFSNTSRLVIKYVRKHPRCSIGDIVAAVDHHYGSDASAKNCIAAWIRKGVIKGLKIEKDGIRSVYVAE